MTEAQYQELETLAIDAIKKGLVNPNGESTSLACGLQVLDLLRNVMTTTPADG